jgi:hypothetical protein
MVSLYCLFFKGHRMLRQGKKTEHFLGERRKNAVESNPTETPPSQ